MLTPPESVSSIKPLKSSTPVILQKTLKWGPAATVKSAMPPPLKSVKPTWTTPGKGDLLAE